MNIINVVFLMLVSFILGIMFHSIFVRRRQGEEWKQILLSDSRNNQKPNTEVTDVPTVMDTPDEPVKVEQVVSNEKGPLPHITGVTTELPPEPISEPISAPVLAAAHTQAKKVAALAAQRAPIETELSVTTISADDEARVWTDIPNEVPREELEQVRAGVIATLLEHMVMARNSGDPDRIKRLEAAIHEIRDSELEGLLGRGNHVNL